MRVFVCLVTLAALVGCEAPNFLKAQDATPRWSATQATPVITEQWLDGFVPVEQWNEETLRIYGDGRWEATRAWAASTGRPTVAVASGSLTQETLGRLLAKAFERPLGGRSFLDLPATIDPGITDVGVVTLAVSIDNASHSVRVMGPKPAEFVRFESAIASQTVALPMQP